MASSSSSRDAEVVAVVIGDAPTETQIVIPGLVPGIQPSSNSGVGGTMDSGDKHRHGSLGCFADSDTLLDVQLQDIVEAVEGAAQRGAPSHLDDLRLAEMRSEPRENLIARAV